ncbi:MAG: PKD domain-containing protein [Dermatophilaceae bacterium]
MYQAQAFLLTGAGVRADAPSILRNVCLYSGRSVPLAVVEAAAHEEIRKRIPVPSVVSSPPGPSLVNLFTIFSTVPAAEQAITFTTPVPGEVRAVPEYAWDFGDGLTGLGPGTPFDPEVLPSKNKGYYLGATYPKPGSKHVALTVTWRVTFRLEGITSVPLAPIVMTASEDKVITTAKAVLVR